MGRDHARFRRNRSWKGEAMSDPRDNVPLSVQEIMRGTLTNEERALLAFFDAPGFRNQMTKQEAFQQLQPRFFAALAQAFNANPPNNEGGGSTSNAINLDN